MSFPSSPSNNQTTVVNGITYVYNSSKTVWTRQQTNALTSTTSSNPPTNATVGDTWYDTLSDVIYRYTNDGSGSYWVDITTPTVSVNTATSTASSGPKITSVAIANSAYISTGAYAVPLAGGYILVNGSGFESVPQVTIGTQPATSIGFVSSSQLQVQVPAQSGGTYPIYVTNSDGSVAINVPGLTYNQSPVWSTGSTLTAGINGVAISIQLAATDDGSVTYAVSSGSSLPSGLSLSSGGLLSGTVTGLTVNTTYNFSIDAVDSYTQKVTQAFSITISVGDTYFPYTTLLLNGGGIANSNNNIFVDSSNNNYAITRSGSVTQGTFTPFPTTGTWSNYFNGSTDYLTIPSSSAFALGSSSFTIEFWMNISSFPGNSSRIYANASGSSWSANKWTLHCNHPDNASKLSFWDYNYNSSSMLLAGTTTLSFNTWYHVAVVRNSNSFAMYLNGVLEATNTYSGSMDSGASISQIGGNVSAEWYNGYISNFRVINGTAQYTSAFTPSTVTLPVVANTVLLTCQANRFVDSNTTPATLTVAGTPSVQRFNPFGANSTSYSTSTNGGSLYLINPNSDWLTATSTILSPLLTSGAYLTIEAWVYATSLRAGADIYNFPSILTLGNTYVNFGVDNGVPKFYWYGSGASAPSIQSSITITAGSWNHIAVVFNGSGSNNLKLYVNGVLGATGTFTLVNSGGTPVYVGVEGATPASSYWPGYISNLRVTNSALYTGNFTPSTIPITPVTDTTFLLSSNNAGVIDGTMQNNLITVGDVKISTTQSKFGGSSMYFDGTGDYLFIPNTHAFLFRDKDFTIELWAYIGNTSSRKYILGPGTDTASHTKGFGLEIYGQQLSMWASSNGSSWDMLECDTAGNRGSTMLSINTWYHIAVTRSGNTFKSFINGVVEKTFTVSGTIYSDATIPYNIGRTAYTGGDGFYFNGYMDDLRITKGVARYTSNFTPPSALPPL